MKHFLYNGIGLSILCDWAVLLNSCSDDFDWLEFERFVENCGVLEFYKCLNSVCNTTLRPGSEGAVQPDCLSGIEADFLEDIFMSSKVYDKKRLSEASAVYYKAISWNTGGNIWTPLGKTLRAVGRGTSVKYSYARKYAFLHSISLIHAYASFFTGTAARAVRTLFASRSSQSVQRRLRLFKRLKIFH